MLGGGGPLGLDLPPDGIGVIAFVAVHQIGRGRLVKQCIGRDAIGHMAPGQQEGDGAALRVGQGVNFGGAPTARPADRLVPLPPFPPEAQRCAFTAEESISSSAAGPPAVASA